MTSASPKRYTFIDLFAGAGGFHLALKPFADCVFMAEINEYAQLTYHENHEMNGQIVRDIKTVPGGFVPDHTILCGGFPCQAFSIAGQRTGTAHKSGDLIYNITEILEAKCPPVVFLENVQGLTSHDGGNTIDAITKTLLMDLGYKIKYGVYNACEYGNVPQNRPRIYIVGFQEITHFNAFEFPEPIPQTVKLFGDIIDIHTEAPKQYYMNDPDSRPQQKMREYGMEKYKIYKSRTGGIREHKTPGESMCLTANMGTGGYNVPLIMDDFGVRQLTPRECFDLQGFPPDFQFPDGMLDNHLYQIAGNSIPLIVVSRIAQNIAKALEAEPIKYIIEQIEDGADEGRFVAQYLDKFLYKWLSIHDTKSEADLFINNLPATITDEELSEIHKQTATDWLIRNQ